MLAAGTLPIGLETDLAWAVAWRARSFGMADDDRKSFREWRVRSVGMAEDDRKAFRKRARVVLSRELPHPDYAKMWALSLVQLGGREEKEIIRNAWDRLDRNGRSMVLETKVFDIACQ